MNKKSRNTLFLSLVALLILAAFYYWPFGGGTDSGARRVVETAVVDRGEIVRSVATSGAVRPLVTVEVGSQLSGQVAEIHADFNTIVKKGQVIARIDAKTFETRVAQDRANLAVAESDVIVRRAAIDRAQANLRKARLQYERAEPLTRQGTLSAAEFDSALAAFESARADLTMAEAQLQNAKATLEQRSALLESSLIDLERTKIRSPIDGVVIERAVDQGQTVAASLSAPILFLIARDLAEIQIEANVDEADIGNVREDNPVTFSVDAHPEEVFKGQVDQVRLAPNELNGVVTYTVIITASNPALKLLPGMTAIVEIITGRREDVLRVSNTAVRFRPPAPPMSGRPAAPGSPGNAPAPAARQGRDGRLWIQRENGSVDPVEVRFGVSNDRFTELVSGNVQEGDRIVTRMRMRRN